MRTVTMAEQGWVFETQAAETVLESAEYAGITIPSSCRNGACRTCMCLCTKGKVRYQTDWPSLSKEEKREGYILPCVAVAETDLRLSVPVAKLVEW